VWWRLALGTPHGSVRTVARRVPYLGGEAGVGSSKTARRPERPKRGVGSPPANLEARKRFSARLRQAMDALDIGPSELAKRVGKHKTTLVRLRTGELGPPSLGDTRFFEMELGLPPGYLTGEAEADLYAIRRARRDQQELHGPPPAKQRVVNARGEDVSAQGLRRLLHAIRDLSTDDTQRALVDAALRHLDALGSLLGATSGGPDAEAQALATVTERDAELAQRPRSRPARGANPRVAGKG
jgi:hypothetical protein